MMNIAQDVDIVKIDTSIQMIKQYIDDASIEPLMTVLEALKKDPMNESLVEQLSVEFRNIGPMQGAVLTYAPYVGILFDDDPFENL